MDNQLPAIQEFIGDEITEADFKVALTKLHLYLQEAIGANGQNRTVLPASVGSGVRPVYTNANKQLVASSSTVGSGTTPVFLSGGTITKSSSTVGSTGKPVFLKAGVITECGDSISGTVKANNGPYAVGSYAIVNMYYGAVTSGTTVTIDGLEKSSCKQGAGSFGSVSNSTSGQTQVALGSSTGSTHGYSSLSGTWKTVGKFTIKNGNSNTRYVSITCLAQRIA